MSVYRTQKSTAQHIVHIAFATQDGVELSHAQLGHAHRKSSTVYQRQPEEVRQARCSSSNQPLITLSKNIRRGQIIIAQSKANCLSCTAPVVPPLRDSQYTAQSQIEEARGVQNCHVCSVWPGIQPPFKRRGFEASYLRVLQLSVLRI